MSRVSRSQTMKSVALAIGAMAMEAEAAPSPIITFGAYVSHQVNVDVDGLNIPADQGNEPTIAVNPLDPGNIVIGWRRFEPFSTVKQAGYGYSFDGGISWGTDVLPVVAGTERTDPVLDVDSAGNFYYQSMAHGATNASSVFRSDDGGLTWSEPVHQFTGDKNWLAIDKTGGDSNGNIYSTWRTSGSAGSDPNYLPKYFIRSADGGLSYREPDQALPIPAFGFGRIAIGPAGEVYLSGIDETVLSVNSIGLIRGGHYFLKSVNAKDPASSPTFTARKVDMGGNVIGLYAPATPNPLGALGDLQIASDQSNGNIYMLTHAQAYAWQPGDDPLDVYFVRSSDGGETWSHPLRVNDDAPGANAFQWFPMLGVAPNARIDAVWYDTRNGNGGISQLYYAYSWDGGLSWSGNHAVTPAFNTHLPTLLVNGEARQGSKMGDYTQLVSDADGAHIAYTATYNGEQDVYYLRVFPDCNNNGVSDVADIQQRRNGDTNNNHQPDTCENITVIGDVDGDKDVDRLDINLVNAAKNQPASGPSDSRDLDHNGVINVLDARKQSLLCTRPRCAV